MLKKGDEGIALARTLKTDCRRGSHKMGSGVCRYLHVVKIVTVSRSRDGVDVVADTRQKKPTWSKYWNWNQSRKQQRRGKIAGVGAAARLLTGGAGREQRMTWAVNRLQVEPGRNIEVGHLGNEVVEI